MRKITLLIASFLLTIGAMAQTPVVTITPDGDAPYEVSDEDAEKIFELESFTIVVDVTLPSSMSGRKAFVCFSDPGKPALANNATGVKKDSPYIAFGINGTDAGYFASSKEGDRFTAGAASGKLSAGKRLLVKYVIDNVNKNVLVIADGTVLYSSIYPVIEYEMPNIKKLKERLKDAKIYVGGGVTSSGNKDVFNGTIHSVKFYKGNYSNTYFRFKSTDTNDGQVKYLIADDSKLTTSTNGTEANSIFLFNENSFLSYKCGRYVTYQRHSEIGVTPHSAVIHSSDSKSPYKIYLSGKYIECNASQTNSVGFYTRNLNNNLPGTSGSQYTIEEVKTLPVTITNVGWATFYAPVAVKVAEGVKAYAVKINGSWATLTEIESGVIPANTGVILKATEAGVYNFEITTTEETVNSDLCGSAAATYITTDAYVLTADDASEAGVCFGKATKNQQNNTSWLNNGHKAYLPATSVASLSNSLRFDFGTTAIEEVETENAESEVIYDLCGRRVNEITKAGIYIIGGRKVLVK